MPSPLQFELPFAPAEPAPRGEDWLALGPRPVRLRLVRNRRARRYVLRLTADGVARVTVPRTGTLREGRAFAVRNQAWLERQLLRQAARPASPRAWQAGTEIFFRGESVRLETEANGSRARLGPETIRVPDGASDPRPCIERHLRSLATLELPPRVFELAAPHGLAVARVQVRNQRSRWGSCSRRGTISLNWRLVQVPAAVRDYLIFHELAHLRQMNHSARFWREVERLCPGYAAAERWLKDHSALLR